MAVETNKREPKSITVSVIKADIGGWVGHSAIHPALLDSAHRQLETAKTSGMLVDYHVTACGDDLQLIMTHRYGVDSEVIHRLAWETFEGGTQVAKDLHLYGAGQDLLSDAFSGNVRGQGPGVAEMDIIERKSEPVLIFMADKTSAGAWNLPLYKMFADPFTTAGLVIAPALHQGFRFEVHDIREHKKITFDCPPRVACVGFQLADGRLIGPRDMFDDPSYDEARRDANRIADVMRMHGPFEPHRLPS
jgi:fructose 1,6-bisphosphate aldolase/phosphatase